MNKKTIKDVDVNGKKVFVRVDYNVPFDDKMNITNDTRMVRTLPTLNYLLDHGAALVIACHIGRPTEAREDKFSTKYLVKHSPSCSAAMSSGPPTASALRQMPQRLR